MIGLGVVVLENASKSPSYGDHIGWGFGAANGRATVGPLS